MNNEEEDFHRKRITQSDYRGSTAKKKQTYLDLSLQKLNIKDKKKKDALMKKIEEKTHAVIKALLPEEKHDDPLKEDILNTIYKRLDLY